MNARYKGKYHNLKQFFVPGTITVPANIVRTQRTINEFLDTRNITDYSIEYDRVIGRFDVFYNRD